MFFSQGDLGYGVFERIPQRGSVFLITYCEEHDATMVYDGIVNFDASDTCQVSVLQSYYFPLSIRSLEMSRKSSPQFHILE